MGVKAHAEVMAKLAQVEYDYHNLQDRLPCYDKLERDLATAEAERDALRAQVSNLRNALRSLEKDARQMREQSEANDD